MVIYAATHGYADKVKLVEMAEWEDALRQYMRTSHPTIGSAILETGKITEKVDKQLQAALGAFVDTFVTS